MRSIVSISATGRRILFTRWSNESWTWKRYRGGTAPEIWLGNLETEDFRPLLREHGVQVERVAEGPRARLRQALRALARSRHAVLSAGAVAPQRAEDRIQRGGPQHPLARRREAQHPAGALRDGLVAEQALLEVLDREALVEETVPTPEFREPAQRFGRREAGVQVR